MQIQGQATKSIHRSESRSTGSMGRHGHVCERSGHRHTYNTLSSGNGRDETGLLEPLCKVYGRRPLVKLIKDNKGY